MHNAEIKLIECPRDAMQGWKTIIPTKQKIDYINSLLKVGFNTIDFGSFVSPKAIPQMADTAEVLNGLDFDTKKSKLLAIIANARGAREALNFNQINYLGFPFSVSPSFQHKNTNSSMEESFDRVKEIVELCDRHSRELVVYISMGFGNPYGDPYSDELVFKWVDRIIGLGVNIVSLADTVGLAESGQVFKITKYLVDHFPKQEIGVHLHSAPTNREEKIEAALLAGCTRFDGALKGIGGCPMADNELVGNMDTEWMIRYFKRKDYSLPINEPALNASLLLADEVFA